ncbi:MAG: Stk1 family PASTA domain-containing Ser/Thr kinase [Lactimicrobium sp.]|jgi:serine/threonine protein kinase/beta-lactam-binding protein with PASTA domain|uniref:Stk1 family PASTA domain-containing Ser/Thr kinase n=1 Tax=Lactimicrobium sp. TaxID=2563780 RepID=UPI002F359CA6
MSGKNMIANRYEVIQHIGQGGMADVFLAIDTILNRQVAIKILRADLSTDAVSILRFEREAQAATALAHPNIVEIYDVGDYKGHHYIVMEYVPGKTLKQIIRERGPLLNEETVDIMKQLVSAISEAHSRGIIHRDIKPQNVIIKSDGTLKILDFGIATAKGSMQLTQANNVMGSVHYLAPELAKGEPATVQSDIYALGIVMFEMLTGDVPFKADQAVQIALMHMRDPLPNVRQINPNVPQPMENIILKAAAKNPADRYQSAADMLADLSTCLDPARANEPRIETRPFADIKMAQSKSFDEGRPVDEDDDDEEEEDEDALFPHFHRKEKQKEEKKDKPEKKHRFLPKFLIVLVVCALAAAGVYAAGRKGYISLPVGQTTVPALSGMSLEDAAAACEKSGLVLDQDNVTYQLTEDTQKDIILSSDPSAGTKVDRKSSVTVTASSGIGEKMADYTGQDVDQVTEELKKYSHLTVKTEARDSDETPGTVISQEGIAAGDLFDPDQDNTMTLVYSAYDSFTIPTSIIGMNVNSAASLLESMGAQAYASEIDPSTLSDDELKEISKNNLVGTVKYSTPSAGSTYTQKGNNAITLYYYSYQDVSSSDQSQTQSSDTTASQTDGN